MIAVIERVKKEKKELLFKINKLAIFVNNNRGNDSLTMTLCIHQLSIMEMYVDVLNLRIKEWKEEL